jgi:hypothetical protein
MRVHARVRVRRASVRARVIYLAVLNILVVDRIIGVAGGLVINKLNEGALVNWSSNQTFQKARQIGRIKVWQSPPCLLVLLFLLLEIAIAIINHGFVVVLVETFTFVRAHVWHVLCARVHARTRMCLVCGMNGASEASPFLANFL